MADKSKTGSKSAAVWPNRFRGQVAVVTGAASGLGQESLCDWHVRSKSRAAGLNPERLRNTVRDFERTGLAAFPFVTDVSDDASVRSQMAQIEQQLGPPDVLVTALALWGQPIRLLSTIRSRLLTRSMR